MYALEICSIRQSSLLYLITWSVTSSDGRQWRCVDRSRGLISDTVPTYTWWDWQRKTWQTPDGLWSRTEAATSRLHARSMLAYAVGTKVTLDRLLRSPEFQDGRHMKVVSLSAILTERLYPQETFLLEVESTPGSLCGRKDYVNEKFQWDHRKSNRQPSGL